jgi:molybdenum cofactor cytidylyltransferase
MDSTDRIFALVLAAGQSKRMQQSKIVLPWGSTTIIGHIISVFKRSGIGEVFVVTGGYHDLVEAEVQKAGGRSIFNPNYANDELTISLQVGLQAIQLSDYSAFFISLGDQPGIFSEDIHKITQIHKKIPNKIIIPSYNMRRGHPWLVPLMFVPELVQLVPPDTLRSFINKHNDDIEYVVVDHVEILSDLDTPEDYEKMKPR